LELPVPAQERLKIREGQANALIRLVLRPLTRTMTDLQANQIRDDVYLALHEGPVKELIDG
jgi:phenylalanyl-tRNA synthetase alpha chain